MKTLLIVDPQNDFITGSLAVAGAKEKMMKLSEYIKAKGDEYDYIFVTLDTHPTTHCSFKENGGLWPTHCVMFTNGWNMPEYLADSFYGLTSVFIYYKGDNSSKEEYSIFQNEMCGTVLTKQLQHFQKQDPETYVDVCGIAGDYCVLETLKGLVELINPKHIRVLTEYVASIDGGKALNEFIKSNNLQEIN